MIYTVTSSPSLDLIVSLSSTLESGGNFRAIEEELRPGGKGINISIMLKNLGCNSTALGFVAGFSGDELMRMTMASGINTGFIRVRRGRTRINIRIKDTKETKINGLGPTVTSDDINYLINKIKIIKENDILVLAGMVPPSLPQDIYRTFFENIKAGTKVIIDTPPDVFAPLLELKPFLVKPNLYELQDFLQKELSDNDKVIEAARAIRDKGAQNVLVSMGKNGAVFVDCEDNAYVIATPGGDAIDRTGAGDSMIAGFISDYLESADLKSAAYMAVATGAATATYKGIAPKEYVRELRECMGEI
ncbi:Tagatose-6-phosphate kinase [Anaerobiospirillum thomasii]|uniref:Phosphofructokinase n=1 Tax=Anaerobiospirillum thomasii TaxID=179995 RepID=A0A2X0WYV4_9GAMM|nr:1-phosphofructokinase family hexose kinase [Anaerobiospirillum thomasii]SPT68252.1 Tagatose-6-phosphate kinase [Anaerobiospirillum thomasii]SPT70721.1 Tagatose-6-phosphate kinase [Anaerobiospirillum thomasii]